jgi:hypothetical protein
MLPPAEPLEEEELLAEGEPLAEEEDEDGILELRCKNCASRLTGTT